MIDELLTREFAQTDASERREAVLERAHQHHPLAGQRSQQDPRRSALRQRQNREVDATIAKLPGQLGRASSGVAQADLE